jgi:hypothetical protein
MSREEAFGRYKTSDGEPRFAESCVLYFDVLGVTAMATGPLAQAELPRLRAALMRAGERAGTDDSDEPHASTWFTDNVVIGTPVGGFPDQEGALLFAAVNVSYMQLILLDEGFLGRGGIAFGKHYMDEHFVFGPALIDAVCLEKSTAYPRVALTLEAAQLVRDLAPNSGYATGAEAPLVRNLLCGEDGSVFVNSFAVWFSEEDSTDRIHSLLPTHRRRIEDGLKLTADDARVHKKWQWLADYFNYALGGPNSPLTGFKTQHAPGLHTFSPFHLTL